MKIPFHKKLLNNQLEKSDKLYVFIDSSNLWAAQKSKGRLFDYQKLIKYIKDKFNPAELKIFYYAAYPADGTRNYSLDNRHKFFTYLKKAGKKVYVFSSKNNISQGLRTSADGYCDVITINDIWGKKIKKRQK